MLQRLPIYRPEQYAASSVGLILIDRLPRPRDGQDFLLGQRHLERLFELTQAEMSSTARCH